jgi:integrase
VAFIQLDDLNWREGTLRIGKPKAKRTTLLPLPLETGRAIADYLRFGRPRTESRALFVRHRAPRDEPAGPSLVRNAVRCAYARCGLAQRWTGTHVLRHSVASRWEQIVQTNGSPVEPGISGFQKTTDTRLRGMEYHSQ